MIAGIGLLADFVRHLVRRLVLLLLVALPLFASSRVHAVRGEPSTAASWMFQRAVALAGTRDVAASMPRARIYALGDATHGTHEFFAAKAALIPELIDAQGVATIAIEAPAGEWALVRDAVATRGSDLAPLLESTDFFFWDSVEMLSFLTSLQERGGIEVVGVDASHPHAVLDRIVERLDSATAAEVKARCACLEDYRTSPASYAVNPARAECRQSVAGVRAVIESVRGRVSQPQFERLEYLSRLLEQGEESLATGGANRDAAMAENVAWLASHSAAPIVFWAHDEHLGRVPYQLGDAQPATSAGTILGQTFGDEYFAIASVALAGTFNAVDYASGVGVIRERVLPAPRGDDVAVVLATRGVDAMYLPLRGAPAELRRELTMRIAGSNVASVAVPTLTVRVPPGKFDAVMYWRTTTPSQLRHYPVIR